MKIEIKAIEELIDLYYRNKSFKSIEKVRNFFLKC